MADWHHVADTHELDEDDVMQVEVEGQVLALYRLADEYYATAGICTHADACLADGFVMDGLIECPLHQGQFDIKTGRAKSPPVSEDLTTYDVKVEDSRILVNLAAARA